MKTIAVIAEFNPFHNGHSALMREAVELSGADEVMILLSGDFVQRGEPAVFSKYVRADMALLCGASAVFELPAAAACGSARRFAEGAVAVLDSLDCVDELWFGSESGDISLFRELADVLADEPDAFRDELRLAMARGLTYAAAHERAAAALLTSDPGLFDGLYSPNNILGIEYCLALKRASSAVVPRTLRRRGADHADEMLSGSAYSSASSIRKAMLEDLPFSRYSGKIPEELHPYYCRQISSDLIISPDDFSDMLIYSLWNISGGANDYLDVSGELFNRIMDSRVRFRSFSDFAQLVKTRDRTLSHVKRALTHIMLGIREGDHDRLMRHPFTRLLGYRGSSDALSGLNKKGQLTLLARGADLNNELYSRDLFASSIYEAVLSEKSGLDPTAEQSRKIIRREPL